MPRMYMYKSAHTYVWLVHVYLTNTSGFVVHRIHQHRHLTSLYSFPQNEVSMLIYTMKHELYVEGAPDATVICTQHATMYRDLSKALTQMCGLCTCT